jgi:hypothetical protein
MSAGAKYEWFWADGKMIKDPIGVSAPEYVDYLMEWVSEQFEDATLFPPKDDVPFPVDFGKRLKVIFKRLFRVYAHVYWHHSDVIIREAADEDLNSGFKHFYLFVKQFDLVEVRDMVPLEHLTRKIDDKTKQHERDRKRHDRKIARDRKRGVARNNNGGAEPNAINDDGELEDGADDDDDVDDQVGEGNDAYNDEEHQTTYYHDHDAEPSRSNGKPKHAKKASHEGNGGGGVKEKRRRSTKVEYD